MLAGVSLALMTGRPEPRARPGAAGAVASGVAVRALLIAAARTLLGGLGTGLAIILTYYGVLFLLGLPFLGLRARPCWCWPPCGWSPRPCSPSVVRPHLPARGFDSPYLRPARPSPASCSAS